MRYGRAARHGLRRRPVDDLERRAATDRQRDRLVIGVDIAEITKIGRRNGTSATSLFMLRSARDTWRHGSDPGVNGATAGLERARESGEQLPK